MTRRPAIALLALAGLVAAQADPAAQAAAGVQTMGRAGAEFL